MLGLSAVAENSRSLPDDGCGSGLYLQINYDMTSGEVWSDLFAGRGHNSWEEYHDPNVLRGLLCRQSYDGAGDCG